MNAFDRELQSNILETISRARSDGTVGMSIECLRQCTRTPKASEGAPSGGNIQWQYAQRFADVVKVTPIALRFVLNCGGVR